MLDRQSENLSPNDLHPFPGGREPVVSGPRRGTLFRALAVTGVLALAATVGGIAYAESAQAAELAARELAIHENGGRVGIGSVDADIPAYRDAGAGLVAGSAADAAKAILDDASGELPAEPLVKLADARTDLLAAAAHRATADELAAKIASLETEGGNVSNLLSEARKAAAEAAARAAAEHAAAEEAARIAAEEAAWEDSTEDWSNDSTADASTGSPSEPAAPAPAPVPAPVPAPSEESYPGLGPMPEDCGPCLGREMFPLFSEGKWRWACKR